MRIHAARLRGFCLLLCTVVLTASASSGAYSINTESERTAEMRETAAAATGQAQAQLRSQLHAEVRQGGDLPDCWDGAMTLSISDGRRELLRHTYCSAYGRGEARLVTDVLGSPYVLLEYSEGHGNRATDDYLLIYKFDGSLQQAARLLVRRPVDFQADAAYDYRVDTPLGGGIILSGSWRLSGELTSGGLAPPPARMTVEIDTPPAEESSSPPARAVAHSEHELNGGRLRAIVRQEDGGRLGCPDMPMTLTILDGTRELLRDPFCSGDGRDSARIITDARGVPYVLSEYSWAPEPELTRGYLAISRFTGSLARMTPILVREPVDSAADYVYDYREETPATGGLILSGWWTTSGALSPRRGAPARVRMVLEVDTATSLTILRLPSRERPRYRDRLAPSVGVASDVPASASPVR